MNNKNRVIPMTIKAIADLKDAEAAFSKLGKIAKSSIDVKSNKNNALIQTLDEATQKLQNVAATASKSFTNSKGVASTLKDLGSVTRALNTVDQTMIRMQNNPENYFTSEIEKGSAKAANALKNVNNQLKEQAQLEKQILDLTGTKTGRSFKAGINIKDITNKNSDIYKARRAIDDTIANTASPKKAMFNHLTKNVVNDAELKSSLQTVVNQFQTQLASAGDNSAAKTKAVTDAQKAFYAALQMSADGVQVLKDKLKDANSQKLTTLQTAVTDLIDSYKKAGVSIDENLLNKLKTANTSKDIQGMMGALESIILQSEDKIGIELQNKAKSTIDQLKPLVATVGEKYTSIIPEVQNAYNALADTERVQRSIKTLSSRIEYFFSLQSGFRLMTRAIRRAFSTVQDLDSVMTETAVVTENTVSDMWDKLDQFTAKANELGATTQGAYETMTLYYQQGLNDQQAWELGAETMKMARIAGMDYADATDAMTAAIRGFNNELSLTEQSAQKVNDVYSKLAAVTASDTQEIATAMSKVASLASSAGMDLTTTATYLAQAIETTREAPENIGTAMKTILARFTALTKDPDTLTEEETDALGGETVDANVTEAALRKAGVALRDETGQIRDAKDILLELNEAWAGLDVNTQRYIATQAAGSRQQSRFLAMMQDYGHTMELLGQAENSAGASQEQFDKTLESLESKLNRLSNAWNEYMMGLANSKVIKGVVDLLTDMLTAINKITGKSGSFRSMAAKWIVAFAGFKGLGKIVSKFFNLFGVGFDLEKIGAKSAASLLGGFAGNFKKLGQNGGLIKNLKIGLSNVFASVGQSFDVGELLQAKNIKLSSNDIQLLKSKNLSNDIHAIEAYAAAMKTTTDTEIGLQAALANTTPIVVAQSTSFRDNAVATMEKQLANNTLIPSQIENVVATLLENKVLDKQTAAEIRTALATGNLKLALDKLSAAQIKSATTGSGFLKSLLSMWPLLIGIAAIAGSITLYKIFGTEGQLKRTQAAIEAINSDLENTNSELDDLGNNWDDLSNSNLEDLEKGTWEWQKALLAANEQVTKLLDKYPELINFTSTDSNGELIISEEGLQYLNNNLIEKAQKLQETSLVVQANEAKLLAKQSKSTVGTVQNDFKTTANNSAEAQANYVAYKAQEESYLNTFIKQLAQNNSSYKNSDDELASKVGESVALALDKDKIKYEDTAINTDGLATLRSKYLQEFKTEASSDLTQKDLRRELDAAYTRNAYEEEINNLLPLFEKLSQASLTYEDSVTGEQKAYFEKGIFTFDTLDKWLSDNQLDPEELKANDQYDDVIRYILQSQGAYKAQTYEDAEGMRTAMSNETGTTDFSQRTQALNKMTGYNFSEEEVAEMWANGTYLGISQGSHAALEEVGRSKAYTNLLNIVDKNSSLNILADGGVDDEMNAAIQDINKFLGLEDDAALSAKTIKNNFDLVKKAIDGDAHALAKLSAIDVIADIDTNGIIESFEGTIDGIQKEFQNVRFSGGIDLEATINQDSLTRLEQGFQNANIDANGTVTLDAETQALWDDIQQTLYQLRQIEPEAADQVEAAIKQLANLNGMTYVQDGTEPVDIDIDVPVYKAGKNTKKMGGFMSGATVSTEKQKTTVNMPKFKFSKNTDTGTGGKGGGSLSPSTNPDSSGGGGGGSDSNNWENPFDKLYNLDKKIEKELREQTKLQKKREVSLRDTNTTIQDLVANSTAQIQLWNQQIADSQAYIAARQKEIDDTASKYSSVSSYIWYDKNLGAPQINYNAMAGVTDEATGKLIEEALDAYENIQSTIEAQEDKIDEAKDALYEIEQSIKDKIIDYQKQLYEAVVNAAQKQIDKLSAVNDSINDANSKLMSAIDKSLARDRQERANEKTEQDLADKQARLAYLQQDTSGANAVAIKQLQKEIADAQEDYTDTLIDQRLDEIKEANDMAAQQREEQIELLQSIHDWQKDYGGYDSEFWTKVYQLQDEAYANNPKTGWSQEIEDLLTQNEALGMSYREYEKWLKETQTLAKEGTEAIARSAKKWFGEWSEAKDTGRNTTITKNRTEGYKTYQDTYRADVYSSSRQVGTSQETARGNRVVTITGTETKKTTQNEQKIGTKLIADNTPTGPSQDEIAHMIAGNIWIYGSWGNGDTRKTRINNRYGSGMYDKVQAHLNAYAYNGTLYSEWANGANFEAYCYATGGLADFTGPAWLDGTPSKPEIVLNAKDSANFIQLRDILSEGLKGNSTANAQSGGDNYYEISVNVDSLSSDYDVEQVAKKIKKMIVNDSQYRNVNAISRLR